MSFANIVLYMKIVETGSEKKEKKGMSFSEMITALKGQNERHERNMVPTED